MMININSIEINDLFQQAIDVLENTDKSIFITGKAGTGKSTLLEYFRSLTQKRVVVLAPTGVAAINVKGETIHSFFRFKPGITLDKISKFRQKDEKKNIYKKLDAIIIDEISMVRADLLDCVDKFLRLNGPNKKLPFGGIQMIFFGDLYQLPPVVVSHEKQIFKGFYDSEYFFSAKVFAKIEMLYLELEKVYRQKDERFISLLNTIRNNSAGDKELSLLNERLDPGFDPKGQYYINLTTTNQMAREINERWLECLPAKTHIYEGMLEGDFDNKQLPTDIELKLKAGSQIMMLNNDSQGRWVNGTMGKILTINDDVLVVKLQNGNLAEVDPFVWEIFHFNYNQNTMQLESNVTATFTQYPLKLAWAITIHKSQGKTFDNVIIDIGNGTFAHGQLYVALSRCRSLDGIVLRKPIKKTHIIMDFRVVRFVTGYQYQLSEKGCPIEDKIDIIKKAMDNKTRLNIIYLKAKDEKSAREIQPLEVDEMEYLGNKFLGVRAFCYKRKEERVFRIDRILEIK